ncbi:MAG: hypothetical protein AAGB22_00300 [Bacteroidota bacterium]
MSFNPYPIERMNTLNSRLAGWTFGLVMACCILAQCTTDTTATDPANDQLQAENDQLKREAAARDSAYQAVVATIDFIDSNLYTIREKKRQLRVNVQEEMAGEADVKTRITDEIEAIKALMKQNEARIRQLQKGLAGKDKEIAGLNTIIGNLKHTIELQQAEITGLQEDLAALNAEYKEVFQELLVSSAENDALAQVLATAWYAFGTKKELVEMGVYTEKGLFKKKSLSQDFNKEYFTAVDIYETEKIFLQVKAAKVVTTHPSDAYEIITKDKQVEALVISDPDAFWSVSKYLLIEVDQ